MEITKRDFLYAFKHFGISGRRVGVSPNDKLGLSSGGDSDVIKADILAKKFQASLSREKKLCVNIVESTFISILFLKNQFTVCMFL